MSTYTPVATQTLTSSASSVDFSSIPQNYTDLIIVIRGTTNNGSAGYTGTRFNSNRTAIYSTTRLLGDGSSASSDRYSNSEFAAGGTLWGSQGVVIHHLQNYSNTTTNKTFLTRDYNAGNRVGTMVSLFRSTDAITSISFDCPDGNGFASGTTFSIYGIQAGNPLATKAQGGNIVTTDGTYWYHTFTSSGSFIPSQALTVDYLVVAGGGAGGEEIAGGGGAGGLRSTVTATGGGGSLESPLSLTAKPYPVIVGAGGAGSTNGDGFNGSNSVFSTITSLGGGGGGGQTALTNQGKSGGSGGGASAASSGNVAGGAGTANQGFAGADGNTAGANRAGGGGGGAGAAAVKSTGNAPNYPTGGAGVTTSISGSSVTYAGGGGGSWQSAFNPLGGSGGGGLGSGTTGIPGPGTANLGGGGGAGYTGGTAGGAGGSGVVIIRYAV